MIILYKGFNGLCISDKDNHIIYCENNMSERKDFDRMYSWFNDKQKSEVYKLKKYDMRIKLKK